eukprot:TRINITY_DN2454_c0_g1_i1.p1 TRINITY_DN2454_c0_g1~~TRINITY_DN2454_c0_g1_i1.p1  ORF type:complete len:199 (-),score=37.30 TRINITY_DN2454_c0_g1_i1:108-704(-)
MKNLFLIAFLLSLVFTSVWCADVEEPLILVQKSFVSKDIVKGKQLEVRVKIFNVGTSDASDISLLDNDWSASNFTWVNGSRTAEWEAIPAQGSVNHTYTVIPLIEGEYIPASAKVTYRQVGKSGIHTVLSSTPGAYGILIESLAAFEKRTATHLKEWGIFLLLSLGSVTLPGLVLFYYQTNFHKGVRKEPKDKLKKSK